mmetsp:Transcript_6706/g.8824  ORF Transcript_6706/g.8824 Transcript_6706/m.8824 type:complete len:189 (+) Transcript_6706:124-690(+)|eukprot:CAMPEP_0117742300 /NCGR_PEP_ID=MMETSP0947-20121206/5469_1 /TAXON_ID=44440 /ORGANISM="Chattonella subsalsa, Strain CCMP2191" /LENGTH=188 /DNA_ID=CAMNT_0005558807 /DNA_START=114 /DNA_END=680 /DNA_ORIENTATION=+
MAEAEIDFEPDAMETEDSKVEEGEERRLKTKGRGHRSSDNDGRYGGKSGEFESVEDGGGSQGPAKSVEGWIVFIRGVHEEAQEDDILDKFSDYGEVKNIHVNLDRRTGFVKGYALIEYEKYDQAREAITDMNGKEMLGEKIQCSWAFVKGKVCTRKFSTVGAVSMYESKKKRLEGFDVFLVNVNCFAS